MRRSLVLTCVIVLALAVVASPGCRRKPAPSGGGSSETSAGTGGGTSGSGSSGGSGSAGEGGPGSGTNASPRAIKVYLVKDEKVAPVRRSAASEGVAAEAVRALLAGPNPDEKAAGYVSLVPPGVRLLGISVRDKTATVDLTGGFQQGAGTFSMQGRLAQLVFTVTQFPTIERVRLSLDGAPAQLFSGEGIVLDEPQRRSDYEDFAPPVLIEQPVFGDDFTSPMTVSGSANVFEAQFGLDLVTTETSLVRQPVVRATSGTGTRGTFSSVLRFDARAAGSATLRAYYDSPKDGSRVEAFSVAGPLKAAE